MKNRIDIHTLATLQNGGIMAISDTLKAFSEPLRQQIMLLLKEKKMTAGDIARELNITPAALSYHLKMLKKADLLLEYKEKNFIWYEINTTLFDELILWLRQFGGKYEEKNNVDSNIHSVNSDTVAD